jgi:hypothetical protein
LKAEEGFLETLDKLIMEKNYLPEKIFNMDQTSLFWKQMPKRIFSHKEPSQCQVSVLFFL